MALETPPRRALGDIAVPVAFTLARRLRKAPRAIAQELAGALGALDGVARVEAAPNGYLNFFLDRGLLGAAVARRSSFRLKAEATAAPPRENHRRAHGDQSEQGGPHRAPAQRDDRRRLWPAAALPGARRSRSRTTSTTPASRSPTSSSASASSNRKTWPTSAPSPTRRGSTTTAGTSTPGSPNGTARSGPREAQAEDQDGRAPRHRTRRQRYGRDGRVHRRPDRPGASRRRWAG